MRPPLAVTPGDPAGIGAEITAAAWRQHEDLPAFFLLDDPHRTDRGVPVTLIDDPSEATDSIRHGLPILRHEFPAPIRPGQPDLANAEAVIESIRRAVDLTQAGRAAAVVTNPISKKVLYDGAGFRWPGHTEFLADLGGVPQTVMMLAAPGLRVVPVTIHIPLASVPAALTKDLIMRTARITAAALSTDFGIARPRLALAGLNPHAGEDGAMGREEIEVIEPAIAVLRGEGLDVTGPLPADTMFHPAARERYDVALTMYHDQGLVPLKMLDFARGVNVTLGLPFIRTSPDHGTAFDIAGQGRADPQSLIEALRLAGQMADRRGA